MLFKCTLTPAHVVPLTGAGDWRVRLIYPLPYIWQNPQKFFKNLVLFTIPTPWNHFHLSLIILFRVK